MMIWKRAIRYVARKRSKCLLIFIKSRKGKTIGREARYMKRKKGMIYILVLILLLIIGCVYMCEQKKVHEKNSTYDYEINTKKDDRSIDIDVEE